MFDCCDLQSCWAAFLVVVLSHFFFFLLSMSVGWNQPGSEQPHLGMLQLTRPFGTSFALFPQTCRLTWPLLEDEAGFGDMGVSTTQGFHFCL